MNGWMNSLIDNSVQCWACPVFDHLFQIVSYAAAAVYKQFAIFCVVLFCVLFAFFVINAVWQNIKGGMKDPWYQKSIKPVFINAIVALGLLSMGVALPRFVTTITFEPVTQIATTYTQALVQTNTDIVNERVSYTPMDMNDDGFYRPQLRDAIITLTKTTITQFQAYMKLGVSVMDTAFSWGALTSIAALLQHILLFFVGLYLFYGFFKLFARFCFYFADIIIAMTFFAFFFPLSLVMVSFKGADNVPSWMSGLGKGLGTGQFKRLINAIISLAAAVLTYTVIMVIIAKFFAAPGTSVNDLMTHILNGTVFSADLSAENLEQLTLISCVILVYVLNFLYGQIPNVTKMVMGAFDVSPEHSVGDKLADNMMKLTDIAVQNVKTGIKTVFSGGETKK